MFKGLISKMYAVETSDAKKEEIMKSEFNAGVEVIKSGNKDFVIAAKFARRGAGKYAEGVGHFAKAAAAAPGAATEAAAKKVNDYIFAFEAWRADGNIRKYKEYKLLFESSAMLGEMIQNGLSILEKEETVAKTTASSQAMKAWELLCAKYGVDEATVWIEQNPEMWEMMKGGDNE